MPITSATFVCRIEWYSMNALLTPFSTWLEMSVVLVRLSMLCAFSWSVGSPTGCSSQLWSKTCLELGMTLRAPILKFSKSGLIVVNENSRGENKRGRWRDLRASHQYQTISPKIRSFQSQWEIQIVYHMKKAVVAANRMVTTQADLVVHRNPNEKLHLSKWLMIGPWITRIHYKHF